jgi:hypothetical protein
MFYDCCGLHAGKVCIKYGGFPGQRSKMATQMLRATLTPGWRLKSHSNVYLHFHQPQEMLIPDYCRISVTHDHGLSKTNHSKLTFIQNSL